MKIAPVNNLISTTKTLQRQNTQTSAATTPKNQVKIGLESLQANFMPLSFKGIMDKIAPPIFEDETLNSIIQRNTDIEAINSSSAHPRCEEDAISTMWLNDEGFEAMQKGEACEIMMSDLQDALYDGIDYEEMDKFFMASIQKLVDLGAIDDKTFVLIDTGHVIPMAAQMMKEENRAALGNVKGTFALASSFPEKHPNIRKDNAQREYQEQVRDMSHKRLSSQALTWGDIISQANQSANSSSGALFVGVDMHRNVKFDPSKLPSAAELKKLGLNKVAVIQELPPLNTFTQRDIDKIFGPLDVEKYKRAISCMRQACAEAQRVPKGEKIPDSVKESIRDLLAQASKALRPKSIERSYAWLDSPNKRQAASQIEKREFGYGTKTAYGSDVTEYLRQLKKDSNGEINVFVEGAALLKLRGNQIENVQAQKNNFITMSNKRFDYTIKGDFDKAFEI